MSDYPTTESMVAKLRPRRFAPLGSDKPNDHNARKLLGVVFDVDGTLCLPQNYMFKDMRAVLGIPKSIDIIEHIHSLSSTPDQDGSSPQSRAQDAIKTIERNAMKHQRPQPGLNDLLMYLAKRGIHVALCTRNFELPVHHLLDHFVSTEARENLWPLVTRETEGIKPKPSPEGIWACAQTWKYRAHGQTPPDGEIVRAAEDSNKEHHDRAVLEINEEADEQRITEMCANVIMVGDSVDDITAGNRAGAATVLLVNEDNRHLLQTNKWPERADLGIDSLNELIGVLEKGFKGRP